MKAVSVLEAGKFFLPTESQVLATVTDNKQDTNEVLAIKRKPQWLQLTSKVSLQFTFYLTVYKLNFPSNPKVLKEGPEKIIS